MTKRRDVGSFEHAIMQCIVALGDDEAAEATGRSAAHIRACSDPDQDRVLSLPDAFALDAAMARSGYDPPLLAAWSNALPEVAGTFEAGRETQHTPVQRLAALSEQFGALAAVFAESLEDGSLCPRDIALLRDRTASLRDATTRLFKTLSPPDPAPAKKKGRK